MSTTDVLVVGAGPVGMAMAMELSLQGVPFRLVDKTPSPSSRSDKSRAIGVHIRTIEVLSRYGGDIQELLATSAKLTGNALWVNRRQYVLLDRTKMEMPAPAPPPPPTAKTETRTQTQTQTPESRFDGPFVISQVDTEAWLERKLAERGVEVEYAVTVGSIDQDGDGVTVAMSKADGSEETLRCKYVVGCDGAHSIVRHSMNVKFEGDAYPQDFILADTQIDWDLDGIEGSFQAMLGDGLVMIFPMGKGRARITASRPSHQGSGEDPTLKDFDEILAKMLPSQESFPKPRLHDPFWLARFHLHHRCVTKYRDGRLFVAGDAAHIHSPVGGQGMNTGIQDSVNLGWKLARVLRGSQPPSFLDSYHEERWPVGQHLLRQTDQIFSFLTSTSKTFQFLRNLALPLIAPWLAHRPEKGAGLMHYFSQLGVKYQRSPIVRTGPGLEGAPVRGGFRAPEGRVVLPDDDDEEEGGKEEWILSVLRGAGYHLLFFSSDGGLEEQAEVVVQKFQDSLQEDIQVHHVVSTAADKQRDKALVDVGGELRKRYGFLASKSGYVLVRPDGYVADIAYL